MIVETGGGRVRRKRGAQRLEVVAMAGLHVDDDQPRDGQLPEVDAVVGGAGERTAEVTVAGVSQLYDLTTGDWQRPLLAELGLPAGILPRLVPRRRDGPAQNQDFAAQARLRRARR